MISIYLTDKINIVSYAHDTWGKNTRSAQEDISARVEDVQKYVKNQNGEQVKADTLVTISGSYTVSWNDKIQVTERFGTELVTKEKEFAIKSKFKTGGFDESHWEIYL